MPSCTIALSKQGNFNHTHVKFCFPPVDRCSFEPSGILVSGGESWNCVGGCLTDMGYAIPIPLGEKFYIQTAFVDTLSPDRRNPTVPFDTLVNLEIASNFHANWTSINASYIGDANNCFDGKYNRQTIMIDSNTIPAEVECFNLRLTVGEVVLETQQFRIDRLCTDEYVALESVGVNDSCDGYFYDNMSACVGNTLDFTNKIWIRGTYKEYGGSVEPIFLGRKKTASTITNRIRVIGKEMIPPYMEYYIRNVILAGETIYVDGEEWDLENVDFTPSDKSRMFFPTIEFKQFCDRTYGCL